MVKYEVVVHLYTGMIVWVYGGIPGSVHDSNIATTKLITHLAAGEKVFADKGYAGSSSFLIPFAGRWDQLTISQQAWNKMHTHIHFEHIERVNKRLKIWKVLSQPWRHELERHHFVFYVLAKLTNVEFQVNPLNKQ